MASPAPVDTLAEHLRSSDPLVRGAALLHVAAHGAAARPLAPQVVSLLVDPDPAVAYRVPATMRAIARGASEAVEPLLTLLERADGEAMLRSRALFCLGQIGPDASPAIGALLELGEDEPVLEALAQIAPLDPPDERVSRAVVEGLFSSDYAVASATGRALAAAPRWLQDRALDEALARLARAPSAAMGVVLELARARPDRALPIAHRAILDDTEAAPLAVLALDRAPEPIPDDVARALVRRAARGDRESARVLSSAGDRIALGALRELRPVLADALVSTAVPAKLEAIAKALAVLAPGSGEGVPHLADVLEREIGASKPAYYELAGLARAIGRLADTGTAPRAVAALAAAQERTHSLLAASRSATLDLQRGIREGLEAIGSEARAALAAHREVDAIDRAHAEDHARPLRRVLPTIPAPRSAIPLAQARPLTTALRRELAAALAAGRRALPRATPERTAEHVDAEITRLASRRTRPADTVPTLGALYGDALVRGLGWTWKVREVGDERALAVVAPRGTHAVLPFVLVKSKLAPGADVTLLLLFRMLMAGGLPPAPPGALSVLG